MIVACGSTRHIPHGCKEFHVLARQGDECPSCRKKTRDAWRAQKALEEEIQKVEAKTFRTTA